jgi:hypothetical protein
LSVPQLESIQWTKGFALPEKALLSNSFHNALFGLSGSMQSLLRLEMEKHTSLVRNACGINDLVMQSIN